jgi:chromosome segregation ATPase
MSEIKPVSIKTSKQRLKEKYPEVIDHFQCDVLFATQDEVKELRAALEALQADNGLLKIALDGKVDLLKSCELALEALQETNAAQAKEIQQWKTVIDCNEQIRAAQAKRIEELEAATEHLGLTPQQAKDGLARYKAQVAEIESLRKQVAQLNGLMVELLDTELGEIACIGSMAPVEDIMGRIEAAQKGTEHGAG